MKSALIFITLTLSNMAIAQQKQPIPLYPADEIPFSKVSYDALADHDKPYYLDYSLNDSKKEVVFLVIPGGGYVGVAIGHEGRDIATRLNQLGYSALVLKYRLPNDALMTNKKFVPLQDAARALEIVKEQYPKKKIAVIGFSAGGHLTATLSNLNGTENLAVDQSKLPAIAFSVLGYPVISMDDNITHKGSKHNLIGANASEEDVRFFSLEDRVTSKTPKTFIVHAKDDNAVVIENATRYLTSLEKQHIPHKFYTYELGGHGFGLYNKQEPKDWFTEMIYWIEKQQ